MPIKSESSEPSADILDLSVNSNDLFKSPLTCDDDSDENDDDCDEIDVEQINGFTIYRIMFQYCCKSLNYNSLLK